MSIINRLFGGCTSHHFEKRMEHNEFRTKNKSGMPGAPSGKILIQRKIEKHCVHDGCDERQVKWRNIGSVPPEYLKNIGELSFPVVLERSEYEKLKDDDEGDVDE